MTIGLPLPDDQAQVALNISQRIHQQQKARFFLDKIERPPFIRFYETVISEENLSQLQEKLQHFASEMEPFLMKWGELEKTDQLVLIYGKLNPVLENFHKAILLGVNPLREGYFKEKYLKSDQPLLPQEKRSLDQWGSPWADPYDPHLLLAKADEKFDLEKLRVFWEFPFCKITDLWLGLKDENKNYQHQQVFKFKL